MDRLGVTFTHSSYFILCLSVAVGTCVNFAAMDSVFIRCCGKFPHHQVFPQLKHNLFLMALSIKMLLVRTFFTNLETVSPDGHFVSGNLQRNFLLHNLYEFVLT
jgi:hypothetical protein